MSGKFENWYEPILDRLVQKLPFVPELADKGERRLAGSHFCYMAMVSLFFDALAGVTGIKWFAIGAIASFYLIYDAEKPPVGRRIDWITRTAGWLPGALIALLILILR